jgi:hypothetical protein
MKANVGSANDRAVANNAGISVFSGLCLCAWWEDNTS